MWKNTIWNCWLYIEAVLKEINNYRFNKLSLLTSWLIFQPMWYGEGFMHVLDRSTPRAGIQDSIFGIVSRLSTGQPKNCGSIPNRGQMFFYSSKHPDWPCGSSLLFSGYRWPVFPGRGVPHVQFCQSLGKEKAWRKICTKCAQYLNLRHRVPLLNICHWLVFGKQLYKLYCCAWW
jgi:hypothetical protein